MMSHLLHVRARGASAYLINAHFHCPRKPGTGCVCVSTGTSLYTRLKATHIVYLASKMEFPELGTHCASPVCSRLGMVTTIFF